MIIDADCHISPTRENQFSISYEELLRRMDKAGVEKAVTWLQPPYARQIDEANRYVYEATRWRPDRILGFGWADPNLGVDKAKDMVKRCVEEYGFYGVKLNGAQNSFYIDDPRVSLPVIEEIAKTGKALCFHVGADAFEQTHPFRVAKVARQFPGLRILIAHMGGVGHHDLTNAMIEFAQQCPNLTLIGSSVRDVAIWRAIGVLGAERLCYGSDTPFAFMHVELAKYKALLGDLAAEDRDKIVCGNIARVLGVKV